VEHKELSKVFKILSPVISGKEEEIKLSGKSFVHYTSAEAAMSIISNKEIWLRHTSVMNDYMEIEHGWRLLFDCYNNSELIDYICTELFPDESKEEVEERLNSFIKDIKLNTFVLSLSEHEPSEDVHGRLSMWRAYGGSSSGVAIVFNSQGIYGAENVEPKMNFIPVMYDDKVSFNERFEEMVRNIKNKKEEIQSLGSEVFFSALFGEFSYSVTGTKHKGFEEEKEWRIMYFPEFQNLDYIGCDIQVINGTPQIIYKILLDKLPDGKVLNNLIKKIIIGPSQYPVATYQAFCKVLSEAGVEDAFSKVKVSNIPMR
jgi:hypothetical protein